jgi:hypothetical protein
VRGLSRGGPHVQHIPALQSLTLLGNRLHGNQHFGNTNNTFHGDMYMQKQDGFAGEQGLGQNWHDCCGPGQGRSGMCLLGCECLLGCAPCVESKAAADGIQISCLL